jgi:hypothetical protein
MALRSAFCAALLLAGLAGCASHDGASVNAEGEWQAPKSYQEEQRLKRLLSHAQDSGSRLDAPVPSHARG